MENLSGSLKSLQTLTPLQRIPSSDRFKPPHLLALKKMLNNSVSTCVLYELQNPPGSRRFVWCFRGGNSTRLGAREGRLACPLPHTGLEAGSRARVGSTRGREMCQGQDKGREGGGLARFPPARLF